MLPTKPMPESLRNGGRQHDDPVEDIQRAFGGRPWFLEVGARTPHRIGLFLGLGWQLPLAQCAQDGVKVNGCKITKSRDPGQFFTMQLGVYTLADDLMVPATWKTLHYRTPVHISKLKEVFAEMLTEAGIST